MTTYVVAGGCFWCVDAVFRRLKGVTTSVSGYAGGSEADADYYRVATGSTGHAEAVEVTFDESLLPADDLLDIFFLVHDPTTKDRQGADVGPQYRSALFYTDESQKMAFEQAMARAESLWGKSVVTELAPLEAFYPGEAEHQDYFSNNPANPYCSVVINPKLTKARKAYSKYFLD